MELIEQEFFNRAISETDKKLLNQYKELKEQISNELQYVILNFPEYTPHNFKHHISNLYKISSNLIPKKIIEKLNITELFLINSSIIVHDWGMAVSSKETEIIKSDSPNEDFPLERAKKAEFFRKSSIDSLEDNDNLTDYLRFTHASRSNYRIKNYFKEFDASLGRILGEICEGHNLDIKEIDVQQAEEFTVYGDLINQKVLSIIIRQIDLLDISKDRTPSKLYEFVCPKNKISINEWKKHHAINPISIKQSDDQVIIYFHGETKDFELYYSLEDLKRYVVDQTEANKKFLKRYKDYYFEYRIDWQIKPDGFDTDLIKFELDNQNIISILASEIYDNDPLIFIRELLQNSIDALKVKELVMAKSDSIFIKKIIINIEEKQDDINFSFEDNGYGMDKFILENYFSKIGNSFYSSEAIQDLDIEINNISKFGIGILSYIKLP